MKKIAIYGREFNESVMPYVQKLFDFLNGRGIYMYIVDDFHAFMQGNSIQYSNFETYQSDCDGCLPEDIDLMLSLGGDGTMLSAVSIVGNSGIPIAGINFGRLGFLASIQKDEMVESLKAIFNGDFRLDQRNLLCIQSENSDLFGEKHFALNDITIFRYDSSAMITVKATLNGELLNNYWADGVIIATPTGSTAYSLSCGGPIMIPGSHNFVITPVSPHNLNVRPVVISADSTLELEIDSRSKQYLLTLDSRTKSFETLVKLKITKADFKISLVRLNNEKYYETLRNKLLWGLDARNY